MILDDNWWVRGTFLVGIHKFKNIDQLMHFRIGTTLRTDVGSAWEWLHGCIEHIGHDGETHRCGSHNADFKVAQRTLRRTWAYSMYIKQIYFPQMLTYYNDSLLTYACPIDVFSPDEMHSIEINNIIINICTNKICGCCYCWEFYSNQLRSTLTIDYEYRVL